MRSIAEPAVRTASAFALATVALLQVVVAQSPHWAFVPPQKKVPVVADAGWCRDEIDRCVLAGLTAAGLSPSPEAERAFRMHVAGRVVRELLA